MIQIFFIAPNGATQATDALQTVQGHSYHHWTPDGATQTIGVIEVPGNMDSELIATLLANAGVILLPPAPSGATVPAAAVAAMTPTVATTMSAMSVATLAPTTPTMAAPTMSATDTTATFMANVVTASGMPVLTPKRYT